MIHFVSIDFSLTRHDLAAGLPVVLTLLFFSTYWFLTQSPAIKNWFYARYEFNEASYRHILFNRFAGFVLMGIFPVLICLVYLNEYTLADYGLTFISETALFSLLWIIGLCMVVIPLAYFSARKEKNWAQYPQIRAASWTRRMMVMNALSWFVYLFGYEFLFRGVLLVPLTDTMGLWPAIAVNVALYAATHIPKGLDETIGAVPLGVVLCILTLQSGTIWIAFLVHVAMAWTNSFTALKYNPATNYSGKKAAHTPVRILEKRKTKNT
ncbi:MAG: CPBP family intramembrane metalloprotease [Bacteroidetes bacterium]|nr:CPBP family intramembrane metalloprotease [Bacteroidota bacterium]